MCVCQSVCAGVCFSAARPVGEGVVNGSSVWAGALKACLRVAAAAVTTVDEVVAVAICSQFVAICHIKW